MAPKQALLKVVPIVVAACIGGLSGSVLAAGDTSNADRPKVDCQKTPQHPDCKGKTN